MAIEHLSKGNLDQANQIIINLNQIDNFVHILIPFYELIIKDTQDVKDKQKNLFQLCNQPTAINHSFSSVPTRTPKEKALKPSNSPLELNEFIPVLNLSSSSQHGTPLRKKEKVSKPLNMDNFFAKTKSDSQAKRPAPANFKQSLATLPRLEGPSTVL